MEHSVRPVIKHGKFYHLEEAHNARMDDDVYHFRVNVESTFFAIKHGHGDGLRARTWFDQFRELDLKAALRNAELDVRG